MLEDGETYLLYQSDSSSLGGLEAMLGKQG